MDHTTLHAWRNVCDFRREMTIICSHLSSLPHSNPPLPSSPPRRVVLRMRLGSLVDGFLSINAETSMDVQQEHAPYEMSTRVSPQLEVVDDALHRRRRLMNASALAGATTAPACAYECRCQLKPQGTRRSGLVSTLHRNDSPLEYNSIQCPIARRPHQSPHGLLMRLHCSRDAKNNP